MSIPNMLEITPGYIQAAFDGEGCLSKTGHDQRQWWVLSISNSDLVWLQAIAEYLKSLGYHPDFTERGRVGSLGKKPVYRLVLRRRREIKRFLQDFPPLMASRKKKAAEFLLWDRLYKRKGDKGGQRAVQEAVAIMKRYSKEML